MLDLEALEQFIAYGTYGTLTKAAEELHISQPTITRTMQRVEEAFGAVLFDRSKNRIELNETGQRALELSKRLIDDAENTVRQVRLFDKSLHTITVESCAPAPLWNLLPEIYSADPGKTVTSELTETDLIIRHMAEGNCTLGILPYAFCDHEDLASVAFLREMLYIGVPYDHALAKYDSVSFEDMNGYNYLLFSKIGFWDALCRKKMPSSKFLVQTEEFAMQELIRTSSLPCFVTNLTDNENLSQTRKVIPIDNEEAKITYYLLFDRRNKQMKKLAEKMQLK